MREQEKGRPQPQRKLGERSGSGWESFESLGMEAYHDSNLCEYFLHVPASLPFSSRLSFPSASHCPLFRSSPYSPLPPPPGFPSRFLPPLCSKVIELSTASRHTEDCEGTATTAATASPASPYSIHSSRQRISLLKMGAYAYVAEIANKKQSDLGQSSLYTAWPGCSG